MLSEKISDHDIIMALLPAIPTRVVKRLLRQAGMTEKECRTLLEKAKDMPKGNVARLDGYDYNIDSLYEKG